MISAPSIFNTSEHCVELTFAQLNPLMERILIPLQRLVLVAGLLGVMPAITKVFGEQIFTRRRPVSSPPTLG
jgi:hypothetical protein